MFGISEDEKDKQIASLKEQLDGLSDSIACEQQNRAQAESRMAAMISARDPAQMDALALEDATRIENLFVNAWDGVNQRKTAVKCVIRQIIDTTLLGAKREDI